MKVRKLDGYSPAYPKKRGAAAKAGAIAAAAVLAAGTTVGCVFAKPEIMGDYPADTELPENTETVEETPYWMGEEAVDTASPECTEVPGATGIPALSPDPAENP